jgi:hypothetical protein
VGAGLEKLATPSKKARCGFGLERIKIGENTLIGASDDAASWRIATTESR